MRTLSRKKILKTELDEHLNNQSQFIRDMVKSIENSIPSTITNTKLFVTDPNLIRNISGLLMQSLNPVNTIELKAILEIRSTQRLQEDKNDNLDPVTAYPQFKRPMFEPLRESVSGFRFTWSNRYSSQHNRRTRTQS